MRTKGYLQDSVYKKIIAITPIVNLDLVIASGNRFLLGKRRNDPAKGEWFPIGGRIFKNETFAKVAIRKAREELGLKIDFKKAKFLTIGEILFRGRGFLNNRHDVNLAFLYRISGDKALIFDNQHSRVRWFSKINQHWHPYVKKVLRVAGFK